MKIKEILQLSMTEQLNDIAKDQLAISRTKAREALKAAGCYAISGKRGWYYDGPDPEILERSVYEFVNFKKNKPLLNELQEKETFSPKIEKKSQAERIKVPTNESTFKLMNKRTNEVIRKRASFDLDTSLQKKLKLYCVQNDKNLYEVVEAALREYLQKQE